MDITQLLERAEQCLTKSLETLRQAQTGCYNAQRSVQMSQEAIADSMRRLQSLDQSGYHERTNGDALRSLNESTECDHQSRG